MTILKLIANFLENYKRVSTAAYLARCGDHTGFRQIMMKEFSGMA
jgi:hypothetical protein